jgi:rubrerythrin
MNTNHLNELIYEALETEIGGVQVYETALKCAVNDKLKEEWQEYLEQTRQHVQIVRELCQRLGLDPNKDTPGRQIVRHLGQSLVKAMEMALKGGNREAAQIVATECVVLAETKDHHNWELIGQATEKLKGDARSAVKEAHGQVEDEEDEHLYHTAGWSRELWIEHLGMPAVLPPPEERQDVKSASEAARAKKNRKKNAA